MSRLLFCNTSKYKKKTPVSVGRWEPKHFGDGLKVVNFVSR